MDITAPPIAGEAVWLDPLLRRVLAPNHSVVLTAADGRQQDGTTQNHSRRAAREPAIRHTSVSPSVLLHRYPFP